MLSGDGRMAILLLPYKYVLLSTQRRSNNRTLPKRRSVHLQIDIQVLTYSTSPHTIVTTMSQWDIASYEHVDEGTGADSHRENARPSLESGTIPWIVGPPLNRIEDLEAIFSPAQPFKIYRSRRDSDSYAPIDGQTHFGRGAHGHPTRHEERHQGGVKEGRGMEYVCVPKHIVEWSVSQAEEWRICGLSVPRKRRNMLLIYDDEDDGGKGKRKAAHPWEFVPGGGPRVRNRNKDGGGLDPVDVLPRHVPDRDFERGLVQPGTSPMLGDRPDVFARAPGDMAAGPGRGGILGDVQVYEGIGEQTAPRQTDRCEPRRH